nr:DUF4038 domain-containing protein [uncultured Clostridium sp.]
MDKIQLYNIFERSFSGLSGSAPVTFRAVFTNGEETFIVKLFLDGENTYVVRFMPQKTGQWHYEIDFDGKIVRDSFLCEGKAEDNHGLVQTGGDRFRYEDRTKYFPFGTTCYAWTHQTPELQQQTLETLKISPFNKIRMCVFPKSMPYNNNEPELFPFYKNPDGSWNLSRPNEVFWRHLEKRISQLAGLGIEADLILFHPYDRWGFSKFSHEEDLSYLQYSIVRLGAFHNVWWSLANEFDFVPEKTVDDWDDFGNMILREDIYHHLTSIHNGFAMYPKKEWMTHCSIQTGEVYKVIAWKNQYQLPVIIDECGYEGDIRFSWGNLSAFEMVHRIWTTVTRGGYCTHGETFHREDEILWWAKGGVLYGQSMQRIAFLRNLLEMIPEDLHLKQKNVFHMNPNDDSGSNSNADKSNPMVLSLLSLSEAERSDKILNVIPNVIGSASYRLQYFGRQCLSIMEFQVPENGKYRIEMIDVWEMKKIVLEEETAGKIKLKLPGKEGIALLVTRLEGDSLE